MINFSLNEKVDTAEGEGIWLDYANHCWLFFVKDSVFDAKEGKKAQRSKMTVHFVQEGIVDLFLLEAEDSLECSDLPFCVKDASEDLKASLDDDQDYGIKVIFLNENSVVTGLKEAEMPGSSLLKKCLKKRLTEDFDSDDFDKAYEKLAMKKEPFEMEADAVFGGSL